MDNMNKRQQEIEAKKASKELGNLTKTQYVCLHVLTEKYRTSRTSPKRSEMAGAPKFRG